MAAAAAGMSLSAFDALAARLADKARRLGEAAALVRRDSAKAWRDARLVWPLFTPTNLRD
ncbi:hypothetical protein [Novosphingobium sp.]|uniref:hypothetical protein n=2 Tax=unclassified Novosphingobium TaxID=2644732 RepID=UPI000ED3BBA8|nr:hypothetical protein [Novosphingobium sp.]HCF24628.1 hypothetical protein [Novosphingobium sp.]